MYKILLITRPDHDITTRYLSAWSGKIIEEAEKRSVKVLDLKRERANKTELASMIARHQPQLIIFNGHGGQKQVAGYDNKILVNADESEDLGLLAGKIVYAISCQSAVCLGCRAVENGALAYIGYNDDFIFCNNPKKSGHPLDDEIAEMFFDPSNQVSVSLLKGQDSGVASQKSKERSIKRIQKLLSSDSSDEANTYAKYLWWNMKNQVCIGSIEAKF